MKIFRPKRRGFTLIEMLIVIAIIATLAAIMVPVFMRARFKTYHSACGANLRNIGTGLEGYAIENDMNYPENLADLTLMGEAHMKALPVCPSVNEGYEDTYERYANDKRYIITCPGIHHIQLPGICEEGAPAIANGVLYFDKAPPVDEEADP